MSGSPPVLQHLRALILSVPPHILHRRRQHIGAFSQVDYGSINRQHQDAESRSCFTMRIAQEDLERLKDFTNEFPHTETGGDLWGTWSPDGSCDVTAITGPGIGCSRSSVTWNQSESYLVSMTAPIIFMPFSLCVFRRHVSLQRPNYPPCLAPIGSRRRPPPAPRSLPPGHLGKPPHHTAHRTTGATHYVNTPHRAESHHTTSRDTDTKTSSTRSYTLPPRHPPALPPSDRAHPAVRR